MIVGAILFYTFYVMLIFLSPLMSHQFFFHASPYGLLSCNKNSSVRVKTCFLYRDNHDSIGLKERSSRVVLYTVILTLAWKS